MNTSTGRQIKQMVMAVFSFLILSGLVAAQQTTEPPISHNDLLILVQHHKYFGEEGLVEMVQRRGLATPCDPAARRRLIRAGAGPTLLAAIDRASENTRVWVPTPGEDEAPLVAPLDEAGRAALLDQTRMNAWQYREGLPRLTFLQVSERRVDFHGTGRWKLEPQDKIVARLIFDGLREEDKVVTVNGRMGVRVDNRIVHPVDESRSQSAMVIPWRIL